MAIICELSTGAFAQDQKMDKKDMKSEKMMNSKNGVMMKDGKMMMMKDGKTMEMDQDMTMRMNVASGSVLL